MEDRNHGLDYKDRFNRLARQQLHKLDKITEKKNTNFTRQAGV